jgi:cytochrome c-type biogenesis protein
LDALLTSLTESLYGSYSLVLLASFAWGVASILLSPCHLSSIPLIVGFLTSQRATTEKRASLLSFVFALGVLLTIAIIGLITAGMGRIIGDIGPYGKYAVVVVFGVVGLYLMDLIRLPDTGVHLRPLKTKSVFVSALVLGLIFGIALGPCTFAFMAPVLGVVFQMSTADVSGASLLLLAFGLGHCVVIVSAGGVTALVQKYLDLTHRSKAILWTKRVAGALVFLGGIYSMTRSTL